VRHACRIDGVDVAHSGDVKLILARAFRALIVGAD
jgi:hypothetical protein